MDKHVVNRQSIAGSKLFKREFISISALCLRLRILSFIFYMSNIQKWPRTILITQVLR